MTGAFARQRQILFPSQGNPSPDSVSISNTVSTTFSSTVATATSFTTSQVTVTTSATALFAFNASTVFREVTNPLTSSVTVYLGVTGVTTASGHALLGATAFDMDNQAAALYGIVSTGSVVVTTIGW